MRIIAVILFSLFCSHAYATPPESQFEDIRNFFEEHVQGITLKTDANGESYDEKYNVRFKRTLTFGKLIVKGRSLAIDLVANVEVDYFAKTATEAAPADEKPIYTEYTHVKNRLELSERVSTGKVVGILRALKIDGEVVFGEGKAVLGEFIANENKFRLIESSVAYEDSTIDGANFEPISRSSEFILGLDEQGHLLMTQTLQTCGVNPETLERTKQGEVYTILGECDLSAPRLFE